MDVNKLKLLRPWQAMVANMLLFARHGFAQNVLLWSVVTGREVPSQDMIVRRPGKVYVYRGPHFPIDPHLKYVYLDQGYRRGRGRLCVELTMINRQKFSEDCEARRKGYELRGAKVHFQGELFLETRTQQCFCVEGQSVRRPRTLITTVDPVATLNIEGIVDFFDILWGNNICHEEWEPQLADSADRDELARVLTEARASGRQEMRQLMSQSLQQKLDICQRQDQRPLMRLYMRQEMRNIARLALHGNVLRMNGDELQRYMHSRAESNPVLRVQ